MKKIILYLAWSLSVVALIVSCDDMNAIHQKYLDAGERVYLSPTDSVTAYPGVGRVKLVWYVNADPKLETTVIYWNMRQDSVEKQFIRTDRALQKDSVIISGLEEGSYMFELYNKNQRGERSLFATVPGKSYGEIYASDLRTRQVSDVISVGFNPATQASSVKIIWSDAPEGCIGSNVIYKKRSTGEEVVLDVDEATTETLLTDVGNRFEHPDDVIYVSSVYSPEGMIDPISSPRRKEQLVYYSASGTRIENMLNEGGNATFTYVNQDKTLRLRSTIGERVFDCSRVAELNSATPNTQFRMNLSEENEIGMTGYYADPLNAISGTVSESSIYNPQTQSFTLKYTVKTSYSSYTVEETLTPKTTPFEKEADKPFGDMRAIIPGDNTTETSPYSFSRVHDGLNGLNYAGWLTLNAPGSTSFTIDMKETMKLTRWINHPNMGPNGENVYGNANVVKFELWGAAALDESKLSDEAYWDDAVDPSGTFKADWEYLGVHEVERLDLKNATDQEIYVRGVAGNHFIIPESAGPVRYIRIYVREGTWAANLAYFFIGEVSFFGYVQ